MSERSNRATVRNPILLMPAMQRLQALMQAAPAPLQAAFREVLVEMKRDAAARADHQWKKHKAPMAVYWNGISVYVGHLVRALWPRPLPRRLEEILAADMTTPELLAQMERLNKIFNDIRNDDEGHGGSHGEWAWERMGEIETELKRRGVDA